MISNVMKKIFFLFAFWGIINLATAQVYSSETCIFAVNTENTYNIVIKFEGRTACVASRYDNINSGYNIMMGFYKNDLTAGYKKSDTYIEDLNKPIKMSFDSELSTSARHVYKWNRNGGNTYYIAVSNDLSTIKCWWKNNRSDHIVAGWGGSGHVGTVAEGVRVDPNIFKPKATNYDFLNE